LLVPSQGARGRSLISLVYYLYLDWKSLSTWGSCHPLTPSHNCLVPQCRHVDV
jgi:hypothetical protein